MNYRIPLAYNTLTVDEIAASMAVLESGFVTQGSKVREFEEALAAYHGVKHAILVNSGSSANLVGIEAVVLLSRMRPDLDLGPISPGDEVIIQGLNWPSTLKPIINMGLTPVFSDVDPESLNAGPEQVEAVRSPRTKMVIAVPVLGNPTYLDELEMYCKEQGLRFFVDACESLGAISTTGRKVGSIGLASAFSFYFSHHITTIEGGVLLTDDDYVADLCYALRAHGWSRNLQLSDFLSIDESRVDPRFSFVVPGYNVRSTDVNAAIGIVQLGKLDTFVQRRRSIAAGRISAIADLGHVVRVPGAAGPEGHSWMTLPLLFGSRTQRINSQERLETLGVETRPIIVGNMLRHPLAATIPLSEAQIELPVCDAVFETGLMIGISPESSQEDEDWIAQALREAANV